MDNHLPSAHQKNNVSAVYVTNATINGKLIDVARSAFIDHSEISRGGTIEFWMQSPPPRAA